jgi:hypothetical protein
LGGISNPVVAVPAASASTPPLDRPGSARSSMVIVVAAVVVEEEISSSIGGGGGDGVGWR